MFRLFRERSRDQGLPAESPTRKGGAGGNGSAHAAADNEAYWTEYNVTEHASFPSVQASLDYFDWRNDQYPGYIDLMPVAGQDGKAVLDYGCGPGNDLVGFGHFSRPARLIGADISSSSLGEARGRLALHGIAAELIHLSEDRGRLPLDDASVDYIHSSGVVHITRDPAAVLREFRRVIRPDGRCRVMIYNYDSLWVHLYVAYVTQIKEGLYADLDARSAFARTTDGPDCPIVRAYSPEEFIQLVEPCGFRCRYLGAAVSAWEMSLLPQRYNAIMHRRLPKEHRKFLLALQPDEAGYPRYRSHVAGIDGCFELTPA
jgi:SAM-dependent methyltransferase